jgi:hypothetical protein
MMKTHETEQYANVGAWWILLPGFREDPRRALTDVVTCALIFASMFGALFLKEILLWIEGVIG